MLGLPELDLVAFRIEDPCEPTVCVVVRSAQHCDVQFVPPVATGNVPETAAVRLILPHAGATPAPPEISAFPVAASASFDSVVLPEA